LSALLSSEALRVTIVEGGAEAVEEIVRGTGGTTKRVDG